MTYSAIIICLTEVEVQVDAANGEEAKQKIERGEVNRARLYDGGLPLDERLIDISIVDESLGLD